MTTNDIKPDNNNHTKRDILLSITTGLILICLFYMVLIYAICGCNTLDL